MRRLETRFNFFNCFGEYPLERRGQARGGEQALAAAVRLGDVIAFEVLATVRRHRLRSLLDDASASHALDRFLSLPIETVPPARAVPGCVGAT